jgi:hypothetical protein
MRPVGFEPTISAGEQPQTYALDRVVTGAGRHKVEQSPSSRTGLRMSGSNPLLPLHAFTARRETTDIHNERVDISWYLVYLFISTLQGMCRRIEI